MSFVVVKTIGTAPYTTTVTSTYRERIKLADGNYVYTWLEKVCYKADAVTAITPVPSITTITPIVGWNSSAFSAQQLPGDVYTQFTVAPSIGVVCGFAPERRSDDPAGILHGFYCYHASGLVLWAVNESGVPKTTPVTWNEGADVFRIERKAGVVRYYVNGKQVYVSATPYEAEVRVVCCMYASNDGVY